MTPLPWQFMRFPKLEIFTPKMGVKFGCCPTVVSKKGWGTDTHRQTNKGTLQLYIVHYPMLILLHVKMYFKKKTNIVFHP